VPDPCPYKGLTPYTEEDAPYFFGREAEREIITANLIAYPLTLLYGPSGVGKSSVVNAGVVRRLRQSGESVVVVFRFWGRDTLAALSREIEDEFRRATGREPPLLPESLDFDRKLAAWCDAADRDLLVILDQFEEYFLYPEDDGPGSFAAAFASAVTRVDARIGFLISVREDALAKIDRFKGPIPNPFANCLRIDHLDRQAARAAIVLPLRQFNRLHGRDGHPARIEPSLVKEVLRQVEAGKVVVGEVGRGGVEPGEGSSTRQGLIETPYLQLILTRLWEASAQSSILRRETLDRLGGAESIVRSHLDGALSALSAREQEVAARIFHHLVTRSRAKIAHAPEDLADYAELAPSEVQPLLEKLSSGVTRILSPVPPSPVRYQIYHDVLAEGVLDWRRRYVQRSEAAEARAREQALRAQAENEARVAARLRRLNWALAVLFVIFLFVAAWAFVQKGKADLYAAEARLLKLAVESQREEFAAKLADLEALQARQSGRPEQARLLNQQADAARGRAKQAEQQAIRETVRALPPSATPSNEPITLLWSGRLEANEDLEIQGATVSRGVTTRTLPPVAAKVLKVVPSSLSVVESPSAENDFRLRLRNGDVPVESIIIAVAPTP